jgi:hypothetical protein
MKRREMREMLGGACCPEDSEQKEEKIEGWMIEKEVLRRRRERGRWAKKYEHCHRATGGNGGGPFLAASPE